ncbi:ADP-ribosylation factor-like protein 6 [Papilio machaon]|uniref:ADP-ribosylation factor-like protein 6 n=2 Tax=Papilio machaon TaxID=76193 RepID=A0A0N1ICY5_PAPMA|nr:ADP-ribosylation factor-like protein 6 [Papilio machaon]
MGLLDRVSGWLSGGRTRATVLVLGLDNSGKSSLLRALRPHDSPATHGDHFSSGGVTFEAHEAPGAARLRALWERHFSNADAIIFVVDAADHLRLVVAREELQLALAHPELRARRLPLLVLANKSDAPHALSTAHVAAALGLERVTDKPWHVCSSSAVCAGGAGLADGVSWLARQLRDAAVHGH